MESESSYYNLDCMFSNSPERSLDRPTTQERLANTIRTCYSIIQNLVGKRLLGDASSPNLPQLCRHLILLELRDPSSVLGLSQLSTEGQ